MEVSLYKLAVGNLATDNRFICLIPRLPGIAKTIVLKVVSLPSGVQIQE